MRSIPKAQGVLSGIAQGMNDEDDDGDDYDASRRVWKPNANKPQARVWGDATGCTVEV